MENPKISIIVPCYNQATYINRCLESVIIQDFENWECLLINDGSTDETESICLDWTQRDERFKYFFKENGGLSSARNLGMSKAEGNYIFFLDSDDRFAGTSVLEKFNENLEDSTEILSANINIEYADGRLEESVLNAKEKKVIAYSDENVLSAYLEEKLSCVACNKLYLKSFIDSNKFSFKEGLLHEDELWSIQLFLKAKNVVSIPDFTYNYYKGNPNSITFSKNEKNYNSLIYILQQVANYAGSEESLIALKNKKQIVRLFERQYYFLKNVEVLKNQALWLEKYKEIQKIYKNSVLNNYQKRFVYPANLAYFALKALKSSENKDSLKIKILQKFITF